MDSERDKLLAALLVRAQHGESAAYEEFLVETSRILRRFLGRRADPNSVEDILQDTLLTLHRVRHTYSTGRPVGPWIYAICTNRISDYYRRSRRHKQIEVQIDESTEPLVQREEEEGLKSLAKDILSRLPGRQRQIIELLKIHGFSVKEVASFTGMSESSVKITAFRGYEAVRRIFGVHK